ncbi:MAG: hypothetical protein GY817_00300 [bacterium]|nr:hypothetical protein [bacterium]
MKIRILCFFILVSGFINAQSPLCSSTSTNFGYERLNSININGQNYTVNTGWNGPGYVDYTGTPVPTITAGDIITLNFQAQTQGNYKQYFKLWIDFNGNGNLNDVGELVHTSYSQWSGTRNFNHTFTVPETVFNGEVYMRFIMVYSSSPTLCGNYSYGNTVDFKTTIAGATNPINHSGYVYGAEEEPLEGVTVQLKTQNKNQVGFSYSLHSEAVTDTNGAYSFSTNLDYNNYDYTIDVVPPALSIPTLNDINYFTDKLINGSYNSKDYWRMDVNNDGKFSVADLYYMLAYMNGIFTQYSSNTPSTKVFHYQQTPYFWDPLDTDTDDKSENFGYGSYSLFDRSNGDSTIFYIIRAGRKN